MAKYAQAKMHAQTCSYTYTYTGRGAHVHARTDRQLRVSMQKADRIGRDLLFYI